MKIVSYSSCSELDALGDAWDQLSERELSFVPSFSELRYQIADSKFRVLAAIDNSQVIAIACFIYGNSAKSYEIASRRLFRLPIKKISLFGSCVLGQPSENVIQTFFKIIIDGGDFDLIDVGEIFIDSPLHNAITSIHGGVIAWNGARKKRLRWLIRLPESFEDYVSLLRATTVRAISRESRRFEREAPEFRVMRLPEEVDKFLEDAEKISRLTYQWKLGYGLCNDEVTRQKFFRLARNETLRCYIIYLRGKPCAFGWGELCHRTFVWYQTGYDPKYHKLSPGTALLMRMIRDLIENTNCWVFDFLWGGEDGYKARFGTISPSCAPMLVARVYKPYSLAIVALDQTLHLAKNVIGLIVEHGSFKNRLRSTLRRCGVGTF